MLLISFVKLTQLNKVGVQYHRVDREDITIIILDTKLVPDFILHACCFFIVGNRPVLMPIRILFVSDSESEIFFLITSEILNLGRFAYFIYGQSTKVTVLLSFRMPYSNEIRKIKQPMH